MHVCMYVYNMYVCMYACMYVCTYVYEGLGRACLESRYSRSPVPVPIVETKKSPTWHRNCRRRRQRARRKVQRHRERGELPPRAALALLAAHHTRPSYREARVVLGQAMGGKKSWQDQTEWTQGEKPGKKWQLWRGSWYASPKSQPQRPQYDKVVVPWQKDKHYQANASSQDEGEDNGTGSELRREIQRALSAARKADLRVRRLKEDRNLKEAQWKIYEQEAKAEYVRERKRFENAVAKIDNEIKEATGLGHEASQQYKPWQCMGLLPRRRLRRKEEKCGIPCLQSPRRLRKLVSCEMPCWQPNRHRLSLQGHLPRPARTGA